MGVVFSFAMATSTGIRSIPPQLERAARNLGARGDSLLSDLIIPASLPQIVSGMKQGWSFAWRSLMAGELLFVVAGLGHLLDVGRNLNDINMVFAVMLVIVAVGVFVDRVLFGRAEAWVHERWGYAAA
jgi:NitT/TauT family transport system permease protein